MEISSSSSSSLMVTMGGNLSRRRGMLMADEDGDDEDDFTAMTARPVRLWGEGGILEQRQNEPHQPTCGNASYFSSSSEEDDDQTEASMTMDVENGEEEGEEEDRLSDEWRAVVENTDPSKQRRGYWKLLYGEDAVPPALRRPPPPPPAKSWCVVRFVACVFHSSCDVRFGTTHLAVLLFDFSSFSFSLSTSKKSRKGPEAAENEHGDAGGSNDNDVSTPPSSRSGEPEGAATVDGFATPVPGWQGNNNNNNNSAASLPPRAHPPTVQFAPSSAAVFERDAPARQLTPMPADKAAERYPPTERESSPEETDPVTRQNTALLRRMDALFDAYEGSSSADSDDDDDSIDVPVDDRLRRRRQSHSFSPGVSKGTLVVMDVDDDDEEMAEEDQDASDVSLSLAEATSPPELTESSFTSSSSSSSSSECDGMESRTFWKSVLEDPLLVRPNVDDAVVLQTMAALPPNDDGDDDICASRMLQAFETHPRLRRLMEKRLVAMRGRAFLLRGTTTTTTAGEEPEGDVPAAYVDRGDGAVREEFVSLAEHGWNELETAELELLYTMMDVEVAFELNDQEEKLSQFSAALRETVSANASREARRRMLESLCRREEVACRQLKDDLDAATRDLRGTRAAVAAVRYHAHNCAVPYLLDEDTTEDAVCVLFHPVVEGLRVKAWIDATGDVIRTDVVVVDETEEEAMDDDDPLPAQQHAAGQFYQSMLQAGLIRLQHCPLLTVSTYLQRLRLAAMDVQRVAETRDVSLCSTDAIILMTVTVRPGSYILQTRYDADSPRFFSSLPAAIQVWDQMSNLRCHVLEEALVLLSTAASASCTNFLQTACEVVADGKTSS
jgi:hypothetical protein